jgi:glutathione S-transferase
MKLYHTLKPHPAAGAGREVRMVPYEKGLDVPAVETDMMGGENRSAALLAKNPAGQLPFLELDDGQVIGESLAICELLDDLHPAPPFIGCTAIGKAETRMRQRRTEFGITENIMNGWRFGEGKEWWMTRGRVIPERPPMDSRPSPETSSPGSTARWTGRRSSSDRVSRSPTFFSS